MENFKEGLKHQSWELAQMQSLSLDTKIRMSNQRIDAWYDHWDGNVYVSRSGGKDSDVLGDLIRKRHPDVPHIFVNTGLEHDSVRRHGTEVSNEVLSPEKNFIQIITEYGYPVISKEIAHKISDYRSAQRHGNSSYVSRQFEGTYVSKNGKTNMIDIAKYRYLLDTDFRISHKCCDFSKKAPVKLYEKETGRHPYIGTLADESLLRKKSWLEHGCNAFDIERPQSRPLSFWTEQDILTYIRRENLQIAQAYGEIVYKDSDGFIYDSPLFMDCMNLCTTKADRTGCVFCMFGIAYDPERFIRLKKEEPKKYEFVISGGCYGPDGYWIPNKNGLGFKHVIDWLNTHGGLNIKY